MRLSEVLDRARKHIAGGWHEPLSLTAAGAICAPDDEGISRFCLHDALRTSAAGDVDAEVGAEVELATQLRHTGEQRSLATWLADSHRLHGDVLALLSRAAAHARAGESR